MLATICQCLGSDCRLGCDFAGKTCAHKTIYLWATRLFNSGCAVSTRCFSWWRSGRLLGRLCSVFGRLHQLLVHRDGVAGIGILINGITAWLFASGQKDDLNIKGAFCTWRPIQQYPLAWSWPGW